MIYLRGPAVLFLKPHKVAGTSFEIALSRFAEPADIVTQMGRRGRKDEQLRGDLGFAGPRNDGYPLHRLPFVPPAEWRIAWRRGQLPKRFRSHSPAAEVRERLPRNGWDAALKVSLVRNPFDAAISTYFWSRREGESFEQFWLRNVHLIGRNRHYYLIDGEPVIDHFIRFEHAAEDIAALEAIKPALAGLGETFAGIRAKSGHRPGTASTRDLFDTAPAVRRLVERECRFEIERFGYTLEPA